MKKKTTTKATNTTKQPREKRLLLAALTRVDRELLIRALDSHLYTERETLLDAARSLYLVADEHGNAKRFDGDWKALRVWAKKAPGGMPIGITNYDKLEASAETLLAKLKGDR